MPIRLLRYIVISILATILPSQAMATLLQNDTNSSSSRLTLQTTSQVNLNEAFSECGKNETTQCSPTSSASQDKSSTFENIGVSRWNSSRTESDSTQPVHPNTNKLNTSSNLATQHSSQVSTTKTSEEFNSSHRIAGWKDTNAQYVALNSQYS